MNFPLSTVVNVSVQTPQPGVGAYNPSNLAIFTNDPYQPTFGSLSYNIYTGAAGVLQDFGTGSIEASMAANIFPNGNNIRNNGGYLTIIPFLNSGETIQAAITRMQGVVQFFGVLVARQMTQAEVLSAAAFVQGQFMMLAYPTVQLSDLTPGTGTVDQIRTGGLTQTRSLYYNSGNEPDAINYSAAYFTRMMSAITAGSKTAQTMNMKTLPGIQPDANLDNPTFLAAQAAGADVYMSLGAGGIGGSSVAKNIVSTTNGGKPDDVYWQQAFGADLQVAYFNLLAQTNTKIPQTEDGMDAIKAALRLVCNQYVNNGWLAPGTWSGDPFGNPADLARNISDFGFYIYSQPISAQLLTARAAGQAPLVQIGVKLAGAVLSGSVLINVNA